MGCPPDIYEWEDVPLEQDDTLTDEVVAQAETNWDESFAGMVTQIDIELTDDGIRQALTLGYLNSNCLLYTSDAADE